MGDFVFSCESVDTTTTGARGSHWQGQQGAHWCRTRGHVFRCVYVSSISPSLHVEFHLKTTLPRTTTTTTTTGQAPVEAVHYIQRFGLFPAVFALPAPVNTMMGTTYGTPCLAVMMEADAVLQQLEV